MSDEECLPFNERLKNCSIIVLFLLLIGSLTFVGAGASINEKIDSYMFGYNGTNWVELMVTEDNYLQVVNKFNSYNATFDLSTYLVNETGGVNMAVDGSTNEVNYNYTVPVGKRLYLSRGFIEFEDGVVAFVSSDFGAISGGLTNGLLVSFVNGGVTVNLENWLTNRQVRGTMFDFDQAFKSDGAYVGRWTFTKDIDGQDFVFEAGDVINFKVRDDLSSLDWFSFKIKGLLINV